MPTTRLILRALRYIIVGWLLALAIGIGEELAGVSVQTAFIVFIATGIIIPVAAYLLYFRGAAVRATLGIRTVLVVWATWSIMIFLLDALLYVTLFHYPWSTMLSSYHLFAPAVLLVEGFAVAAFVSRKPKMQ